MFPITFSLQKPQKASRWSLTLEALVRCKLIPCELCVGQNGRRIEFSPNTSCLPGLYSVTDVDYTLFLSQYYCHLQQNGANV